MLVLRLAESTGIRTITTFQHGSVVEERLAYIALNMMEDVGPVGVRALSAHLGSVTAIFDASEKDLTGAEGIGPRAAQRIIEQRDRLDPLEEIARAETLGAHIVTPLDAEYPEAVQNIYDPPLALTVRGSLLGRDRHSIAVVGTRSPSHYGRETAGSLSQQIVRAGFTVTSGLARGVDTAAHRGALDARGRTVAVLGGGLDCLYPRENAALADEIAGSGAVITELPMGRKPDRTTFPMRNRIVSGMSKGILVVEAGLKSGALITARQALEQGRIVFAVPGRIDNPSTRGCHQLIKEGARLVEMVDDVLEEFEFLMPVDRAAAEPAAEKVSFDDARFSDDERAVMAALTEGETDVDTIIRLSGMAVARVNALLLGLEMKRALKLLPGRIVARAS